MTNDLEFNKCTRKIGDSEDRFIDSPFLNRRTFIPVPTSILPLCLPIKIVEASGSG